MLTRGVLQTPRVRLARGLLVVLLAAGPASAQPIDRPVQERPELPEFAEEEPLGLPPAPAESMLPEVPVPEVPDLRVTVRGYQVEGGTVFTPEEIARTLSPWVGRELSSRDLVDIRNALTELYVEAGYLNSGAVIPDQDLEDGTVRIILFEGALTRVDVTETDHYRPQVLADRVRVQVGRPLRVQDVERALRLLQQDPRIEQVHARLAPGERPGEAVLSLRVEEARPYRVSLEANNYSPVSFGSYQGRFLLAHENLLGFGDSLRARFRVSGGYFRFSGDYRIPITPWGTTAYIRGEHSISEIIERDFRFLDIETDYKAVRVGFDHPVWRTENDTLKLGIYGEWRRSDTDVEGMPFSFRESGGKDGLITVSLLRFVGDYVRRERKQVISVRSQLSVGLPVLGARSGGVFPDGRFVAWLGQVQWARRYDFLRLQTIFRADAQFGTDALPTLERFVVGGHLTVRGYRENQLVRDQGVVASVEARVPLWHRERPILEIAPFFDFGWSENRRRITRGPDILASVGGGLRWSITEDIHAQVYYGYQLEEVFTRDDLQDDGVQFRLVWDAF